MRFESTNITSTKEILFNDHYVAIPYDCSAIAANSDGIIKAGTMIPANDATAIGVLLWDVDVNANPNGTVVIHGFIKSSVLPEQPADTVKLPQIKFM